MKHVVDPIYAYILDTPLLIDSLEYLLKHRLAQDAKIGTSALRYQQMIKVIPM